MQINKVKCLKYVNGRLKIRQRLLKNGGSAIVTCEGSDVKSLCLVGVRGCRLLVEVLRDRKDGLKVVRLFFVDISPDPAWIRQTVQLRQLIVYEKLSYTFESLLNRVWDSGANRRLKKTDAKGLRWECAGRTFHSCLHWDPLSEGTVSDSYRRGLSLRGERQKRYLNNSRWMIDRHLEMRGKSSAKVSSIHCLRVADVRLALITVFVSYPSLSAARSSIQCVLSV